MKMTVLRAGAMQKSRISVGSGSNSQGNGSQLLGNGSLGGRSRSGVSNNHANGGMSFHSNGDVKANGSANKANGKTKVPPPEVYIIDDADDEFIMGPMVNGQGPLQQKLAPKQLGLRTKPQHYFPRQ